MRRKRCSIVKNSARFLLSDTLPYEVPIIFNNRLLAQSIRNVKFPLDDVAADIITVDVSSLPTELQIIIMLLDGDCSSSGSIKLPENSIPYEFFIPKADGQLRKLAVINPLYQISMMVFNEAYSNTLLYNCSKSQFSIRKPTKKATWKVYNDNSYKLTKLSSDKSAKIEEMGDEYDELRSYYVYNRYSNVYKFYDSNEYLELEKKYTHLMRLDISKCFDSIYTHSIPWAVYGKEYVKDHLFDSNKNKGIVKCKQDYKYNCFDKLDRLMQRMNYRETHGIVIGPEFSRIVAEVILQAVDIEIEKKLGQKYQLGMDYSIFRYVDDYFVFYNNDQTRIDIINILQQELVLFKLYLNKAKETVVSKPFITGISIAKSKILDLIDFIFPKQPFLDEDIMLDRKSISNLHLNSATIIKNYKAILVETQTSYSDTMNFTLSIIEKRLITYVNYFTRNLKNYKNKNINADSILSIIGSYYLGLSRILFFMFTQNPSASISIKVCRNFLFMLESLNSWKRKKYGNTQKISELSIQLKQYLFSEICSYLEFNPITNITPVEGLLLLVLARELGGKFKIPCVIIERFLSLDVTGFSSPPSYFTLMVVLFYVRNNRNYGNVYINVVTEIQSRLSKITEKAEDRLLLIDCLACPYLEDSVKVTILANLKLPGLTGIPPSEIINATRMIHFIKWDDFFLSWELDLKRSQLVY